MTTHTQHPARSAVGSEIRGDAHGNDPRYHAIQDDRFICTAPPDAPCRTSPTCECENWCGCDGSPEDAKDNHDGRHCCMTTTEPGQGCWLEPWVNGAGLGESCVANMWASIVDGLVPWPEGPVVCDWADGVFWTYARAALTQAPADASEGASGAVVGE